MSAIPAYKFQKIRNCPQYEYSGNVSLHQKFIFQCTSCFTHAENHFLFFELSLYQDEQKMNMDFLLMC